MNQKRVICIAGARPNFVKLGPIVRGLSKAGLVPVVLHTGQHYDHKMSDVFFEQLGLPKPDGHLEVGSASHAVQTARIMERFDAWIDAELEESRSVNAVLVVGDVNSTAACAMVAAKRHIPAIHVEAGLRSFDRKMPEELNRIVTDGLCDLLLCSEPSGVVNLEKEGMAERTTLVGNVMIDVLKEQLEKVSGIPLETIAPVKPGEYALVTMHRPQNVDAKETLRQFVDCFVSFAEKTPIVFPIHPRTRARLEAFGLLSIFENNPNIHLVPPQGYHEFLRLSSNAKFIMTDSGGLQEESAVLGVPCLTLRPNTERPVTLNDREGSSTLIGTDFEKLRACVDAIEAGQYVVNGPPQLWDGQAGVRVGEEVARLVVLS